MYCRSCGKPMEDALLVCPVCGAAQNDPKLPPPGLRRRQFYKSHFRCRRSLRMAGILCYVCAVLTLVQGTLQGIGLWALVDLAILLFFGGLMHLLRSRPASIVICAYAAFCLLTVFINGFAGLFALVVALLTVLAAVLGVRGTFCFANDWNQYCIRCGKVH